MILSENEVRMFMALGVDLNLLQHLGVMPFYKHVAETCFIENRQGPQVDLFRRVYKALFLDGLYRKTPEFEQLLF